MGINNPVLAGGFDATITPLSWIDISPSDTVNFDQPIRGIRCKSISGTAGVVSYVDYFGNTRTDEISKGETLMVMATRVNATGTAAAGLKGAL